MPNPKPSMECRELVVSAMPSRQTGAGLARPVRDESSRGGAATGLLGLAGLGWRVWVEERTADAERRLLQTQQQRLAARRSLAESELAAEHAFALARMQARTGLALEGWSARLQIAQVALEAEEAEAECAFRRRVYVAPPEQARQILGASLETERLLGERERLRRQQRTGSEPPAPAMIPAPPSPLPPAMPPALPAPALEEHVSDRQIEALALRAVTRFGGLPPEAAERAWQEWRRELERRLPPYAVQEVCRRAEEVRGLAR
jgi:hypothetical protein